MTNGAHLDATLVLIVDDDPDIAFVEQVVVESAGYTVFVAATAASAVATLTTLRPVVVLLDVMLPDGSGYDVLDHIRSTPHLADVAVIMVSAMSAPAISRANPAWDAYLQKPFTPDLLVATIRSLLGDAA